MKDTAQRLAALEIVDAEETPVVMGQAWKEQLVLLVFIRHFG